MSSKARSVSLELNNLSPSNGCCVPGTRVDPALFHSTNARVRTSSYIVYLRFEPAPQFLSPLNTCGSCAFLVQNTATNLRVNISTSCLNADVDLNSLMRVSIRIVLCLSSHPSASRHEASSSSSSTFLLLQPSFSAPIWRLAAGVKSALYLTSSWRRRFIFSSILTLLGPRASPKAKLLDLESHSRWCEHNQSPGCGPLSTRISYPMPTLFVANPR